MSHGAFHLLAPYLVSFRIVAHPWVGRVDRHRWVRDGVERARFRHFGSGLAWRPAQAMTLHRGILW